MNALSHNVIMADRKKLKSANGMYLGSTGSGKSFAAKRELLNVFLTIPQDRIIIVDPMGEYAPLVRRLGGQVIEIAPDSPHHLNPMDVELNMAAGESPLSMKADFLLSLCELVVGGKEGLQPIEKTVIDRCVRLVYREQALGLETAKTPLLQDLYEELLRQPEPEARRVATALELYCTGSLNLFNHPTNVKTDSRVVCIVLKNMGENLRKIAMHITNEFVSQAVDTNFREGVATWCYPPSSSPEAPTSRCGKRKSRTPPGIRTWANICRSRACWIRCAQQVWAGSAQTMTGLWSASAPAGPPTRPPWTP